MLQKKGGGCTLNNRYWGRVSDDAVHLLGMDCAPIGISAKGIFSIFPAKGFRGFLGFIQRPLMDNVASKVGRSYL